MKAGAKKIRVTFVINDFLVGGVQRLHVDLLSRLNRELFDISLVTLFSFEDRPTLYELLPEDIAIYRHNFKHGYDIHGWFSLARTLKEINPAVVVSNLFLSNFITRIFKLFLGYKAIAVEHNTYIHKTRSEIFLDKLLSYLTFAIVAVSDSVRTFTAAQEHIPLSKFVVIPNGIDIATIQDRINAYDSYTLRSKLGSDRRYIVSTARLAPQKNHALLIDGFAQFAKENKTHDLLIVGGGGLMETLEERTHAHGISDRVHFLGNQMDVYRYYAVSDFFVSTSEIEGFGIAHAEALACGLSLLSTKTAGPDKMIEEGKTGFFIESTPESVARGMKKMLTHLEEMKPHTKEQAAKYDIGKTVASYGRLIEGAVSA